MFYVLLSQPEHPPLEKVAEVLSRVRKVPLIDARLAAKRCWGFLGGRVAEADARPLVTEATRVGLSTVLLEQGELAEPPPAQTVRMARCEADAFHFTVGSETQERSFPWDRLRL